MATPSPICTVKNGGGSATATTDGVDVTPAATITIALAATAGVAVWGIECIGTDETTTPATITALLTIDSVLKQATFTAPAAGTAMIFRSTVRASGSSTAYTATFKICTLTSTSLRVGALGETAENSAAYGWVPLLNAAIRGSGNTGAVSRNTAVDANHLYAWDLHTSSLDNAGGGGVNALTAAGADTIIFGTPSSLGGAASHMGSGNTILYTSTALSGLTTTSTWEFWVQPFSYPGSTSLMFGYTYSGGQAQFISLTSTGTLTAQYKTGTGTGSITGTAGFVLPLGVWTHLALVADGTNAKLYANGEEIGTVARSGTIDLSGTGAKTVLFGDSINNSGTGIRGKAQCFRISNIARTQAVLRAIYAKGISSSDYASVT